MARYSTNPETMTPETIWRGIDTIKIGCSIQRETKLLDTLEILKKEAQKGPTNITLGNYSWAVLPYGAKKFKYSLQYGQLSLFISAEDPNRDSPNMMIEAYPESITRQTPEQLIQNVSECIEDISGKILWNKISELHLTTDTHVTHELCINDIYDEKYQPLWISRCRKNSAITNYDDDPNKERLIHRGSRLETISYGGTLLMMRIYNKIQELKQHPAKQWERGLWNNPYAQHVTRVEYQLRREKLKQFGINDIRNLTHLIPGTWNYLTEYWFTIHEMKLRNGRRNNPVSEFWNEVQNAWKCETPNKPVARPQINAEQRLSQAWGNLLSAAAILDNVQEDEIHELYQIWIQTQAKDWTGLVLERQKRIVEKQGRIQIRDRELEMTCAIRTPLPPPLIAQKEAKTPSVQLEGGMLFTMPNDPPASGSAGGMADDSRKEAIECDDGFYYP
ncbi:MAG: hypothetical protein M0Z50_15525 [Planctomycetia bacterium]|nr:hypothetical protein [Planctomycetia bacterium]